MKWSISGPGIPASRFGPTKTWLAFSNLWVLKNEYAEIYYILKVGITLNKYNIMYFAMRSKAHSELLKPININGVNFSFSKYGY